jgi:hypothetical protein
VDLQGKGGRVRTVAIPIWVKQGIDACEAKIVHSDRGNQGAVVLKSRTEWMGADATENDSLPGMCLRADARRRCR